MGNKPGLHVAVLAILLAGVPAIQSQAKTSATAADTADWQVELAHRHEALVRANGPGTDVALRTQLLTMGMQDQEARGIMNGEVADKTQYTQAANLKAIDAGLTAHLKTIVEQSGWPTVSLVGDRASQSAMLILIHSQDHSWQRSLLPQLEQLADTGKIDGSSLAILIDKELISEGKLQRYGTQFTSLGDRMAMYAVEDPAGLDARRARVFLPPMSAYEQQMSDMYHLRMSKEIVSPKAPAVSAAK